ncbi:MAG: bifunctional metallophosphatase/5'-nucleotidase [Paludibacteraceae bacterium]|nr:bifunctional metallophosphatase/5'-nucleotidase [Paludibacteraceae bacterium]
MKLRNITLALIVLLLAACQRTKPIVILYENDVHCAVEGYARLAGQRDAELQQTPYVSVVSCGDFAQGNTVGSLTRGEAIVRIMNAVGYDYLTVGNHEFDYTVPQMEHLSQMLTAKTLCCNFSRLTTDGEQDLFPAYEVKNYGGTKVAFVGVATPSTFRSSTPTYFVDDDGNLLYNFHQHDTYERVQQAVDEARGKGAKIVIVLSHLGDDPEQAYSRGLIAATHGIDIVLDGHAHHLLNERLANDKGDSVTLASTATKFAYIGRLTIDTDNRLTNELLPINDCHKVNQAVWDTVQAVQQELEARVSAPVGKSPFALTDRDADNNRLVRQQETNLGDFMADVARYTTGADIGVCNGGGLRTGLYKETITFGDIVSVWPFNNTMRVVECTGQQLIDALEVGVAALPLENGDFLHVSGLRYTADTRVPTSVIWDENRMFDGVGKTRRIVKAEVFVPADGEAGKLPYEQKGTWQPIAPEATYTIGGQSYIIACSGASGTFAKMRLRPIEGEPLNDVDAVCSYIRAMGGTVSDAYRLPQGRIIIK